MKILSIALLAALSVAHAEESAPREEGAFMYIPALVVQDMTFVDAVLKQPKCQAVADTLANDQRGHLDEAFSRISLLGRQAELEAQKFAQQNWPVRKNMLNHLRNAAARIVALWCEPHGHWFCSSCFLHEALNFIDTRFCSVYSREMAEETCYPEAVYDFNRARLSRHPSIQY